MSRLSLSAPMQSAPAASQSGASVTGSVPSRLRRRILCAALALALFFGALFLFTQSPFAEEKRFVKFTENIFVNEMSGNTLNQHYTIANPSAYHLDRGSVTLGNASLDARKRACAVTENYLTALKKFDYDKLSPQRQLTYDIFYDYLETELEAASFLLYDEPLSPTLGIQAQLPILLAEYCFRTKGDIEDYLCLLTQIPDYFSSILSFESAKSGSGLFMSKDCALEVIRQCQEFIEDPENNYLIDIFNEKIDAVTNLTADEKIAYKTRNRSILTGYVVPAYENLIAGLAALMNTGTNSQGLYYYPEGTAYYEYLVKSTVGDDRSIEEIEEAVKVQMVADYTAIEELLSRYQGLSSKTEAADVTAAAIPSASASDPEAMLTALRQKITTDFPLLPEVSCNVKYVHSSLQEYLSPAFYLTPAIDDYENNVIYINPASDYNELELFTTLAHEGYPGHLYQSVYFASQKPDLLRNLLDVGGYTEGWATYVEMYAYSLWDGDSLLASLCQHNRSFTLGLASLLDIGIHYRGYSLADVTAFLEKLGFDGSTAESLYQTILQSPANYLQYYVGCLNFYELRDACQEQQQESFSLKEFHRQILETGPAPFYILRERLLGAA